MREATAALRLQYDAQDMYFPDGRIVEGIEQITTGDVAVVTTHGKAFVHPSPADLGRLNSGGGSAMTRTGRFVAQSGSRFGRTAPAPSLHAGRRRAGGGSGEGRSGRGGGGGGGGGGGRLRGSGAATKSRAGGGARAASPSLGKTW